MKSFNRRNFLKKTAAGAAGLAVVSNMKGNNLTESGQQKIKKVITRKLGKTGLKIPVISMGCGRVDSPSVVKGALKLGINHFDTAYRYQKGNSEKMLGEVLVDYPRDSFTIATKVKAQDTKEKFLSMLDESLTRLQMDYVDILYLHAISSKEQALDPVMLDALQEAKSSGKAKHLGISTHKNEPEIIQAAIDSNVYEVVLSAINFKQEHFPEIQKKMKAAQEKGIGFIAMKVMAGGFLDAEKLNKVNHTAALKWALIDSNITTTIPSMINLEQLQENAKVLHNVELTDQESNELIAAMNIDGIYCNGCESCVDQCQKNLPIAEMMRAYMYSYGYNESLKAKELLSSLKTNANPCSDCNACTVKCVKNFDVAQKIKDISQLNNIPDNFLA